MPPRRRRPPAGVHQSRRNRAPSSCGPADQGAPPRRTTRARGADAPAPFATRAARSPGRGPSAASEGARGPRAPRPQPPPRVRLRREPAVQRARLQLVGACSAQRYKRALFACDVAAPLASRSARSTGPTRAASFVSARPVKNTKLGFGACSRTIAGRRDRTSSRLSAPIDSRAVRARRHPSPYLALPRATRAEPSRIPPVAAVPVARARALPSKRAARRPRAAEPPRISAATAPASRRRDAAGAATARARWTRGWRARGGRRAYPRRGARTRWRPRARWWLATRARALGARDAKRAHAHLRPPRPRPVCT